MFLQVTTCVAVEVRIDISLQTLSVFRVYLISTYVIHVTLGLSLRITATKYYVKSTFWPRYINYQNGHTLE
jgi:hypothetical protein